MAEKVYLEKDNYLSEYNDEPNKSIIRSNLNVPSKDDVYTKTETETKISEKIAAAAKSHLSAEDPHGTLPTVESMIADMVKTDGSTPFTSPQKGIEPQQDNHLATKKYTDRQLQNHLNTDDPHKILPEVENRLNKYVKLNEVLLKDETYTKNDVDDLLKECIKRDGMVPFSRPQVGIDPQLDSHLATKRYIDKVLYNHTVDVDPHGFISTLNQRLAFYIKKKDVFDKTQTYSRTQIDSIIHNNVEETLGYAIQDYMDSVNDKFEHIRKEGYVKDDGSVPFKNPQAGVPAVNSNEFVTLMQLGLAKKEVIEHEPEWITSGPVQTTVGFVEDESTLPNKLTFQEIMDAIFYGQGITIDVDENTNIGEKAELLLCIHGGSGIVKNAYLYQNGKVIHSFTKESFVDGCITVDSEPVYEDTIFKFEVNYETGSQHQAEATTKVSLPIFVGLLSKWRFANYVSMAELEEMIENDPVNNKKLNLGKDVSRIVHQYKFEDKKELKHPFLVIPEDYPSLYTLSTDSQQFRLEAFDVIDKIPLTLPGGDKIYKMYVYKQALSSMDQEVTYNLVKA